MKSEAIESREAIRPAATHAERTLNLLKRAGMFGTDTRGCVIERAYEASDLRAAYRLVHQVFVGAGYIQPHADGIRLRIFEASPDTATFVAKKDGEVVAVLSVVGDTPELGLPSDAAFKPELDAMRRKGRRLCEITNQAVAEDYRRSSLTIELMRCAIAFMVHSNYERALATVSPSHENFYRVIGFRGAGSMRSYSPELHDPVVALHLKIDLYRHPGTSSGLDPFAHQVGTVTNTFLASAADWTHKARKRFLDPELLQALLASGSNFLSECTKSQLRYLRQCWGAELFKSVCVRTFSPRPVRDLDRDLDRDRRASAHGSRAHLARPWHEYSFSTFNESILRSSFESNAARRPADSRVPHAPE